MPILMYHIIGEPPAGAPFPGLYVRPADFRAQVAWLGRHGYSAVTLSDVWEHWHRRRPLPARPIVFTFDDGYRSTATVGLPTLRRRGWPAVLNLKVENLRGGISPAQVRALLRAGWELGAHTITHPDLTGVDAAQLKAEVRGSRSMLERRFGVRVWFFCYPSGRYDGRVVRAVRLAGFRGATTTEPGLGRRSEPFTLDRIRVSRGDSAAAVGARVRAER